MIEGNLSLRIDDNVSNLLSTATNIMIVFMIIVGFGVLVLAIIAITYSLVKYYKRRHDVKQVRSRDLTGFQEDSR